MLFTHLLMVAQYIRSFHSEPRVRDTADLPPGMSPPIKLGLGPFEVHARGWNPMSGIWVIWPLAPEADRPRRCEAAAGCTPWIRLSSPARLGRRGIPRREVIRLAYAAWFCSPIFSRQDRDTTHHRLDGQSSSRSPMPRPRWPSCRALPHREMPSLPRRRSGPPATQSLGARLPVRARMDRA